MTEAELDETCSRIGYGAVKYFDLKQHPSTNYVFNYDRMLDTKGDTAVYLMFAYARLVSILKKAKDEKHIDILTFLPSAESILSLAHPAERALAFELMQFGDVVQYVLQELLPNRLCEYLKEVSVKFTEFVTKCHVLNAEDDKTSQSRLLLCEATRQVMFKCFDLLGIQPVDRI
jgi:arginyl-tRNA synthetase